jgi:hypothetical protein
MAATLLVYDPTAPASTRAADAQGRLDGLSGKTVGFIDNAKPNFDHLVDDLAELLVARFGVAAVIKRGKRGPSMPVAQSTVEELAGQCDLVITGSGD